jgi:hypothetical protein
LYLWVNIFCYNLGYSTINDKKYANIYVSKAVIEKKEIENIRKSDENQVLYILVESEHFKNYNMSYSVFYV